MFATICFAQDRSEPLNSCTQSDSPIIQGLRLGTPFTVIKRDTKLELTKKTAVPGREGSYLISSPNKNVDFISLTFYKSQLFSIMVTYSKVIEWNSLEEFASKTSESLNVFGRWKTGAVITGRTLILRCSHFNLALTNDQSKKYVIYVISNGILLQKLEDKIKEQSRRRILNQKRKEIFKP
jgi:hypothetical protein